MLDEGSIREGGDWVDWKAGTGAERRGRWHIVEDSVRFRYNTKIESESKLLRHFPTKFDAIIADYLHTSGLTYLLHLCILRTISSPWSSHIS